MQHSNADIIMCLGEVSLWYVCSLEDESVAPNLFIAVKALEPRQIDFPQEVFLLADK